MSEFERYYSRVIGNSTGGEIPTREEARQDLQRALEPIFRAA